MFEPSLLITYIAACFIFSMVPGPSVTAVLANSLSRGTRAGFLVILGTEISMLSMVAIVALGLEAVVQMVGGAFFWIKLAGAAYLIWIGWQMFNARGALNIDKKPTFRTDFSLIMQGFMINWSNPKTLLFLGAFLPQFVNVAEPAFAQIMVLGLIVMAVATLTDGAYAILAGRARHILTAVRVRMLSRISGVILMAGGVWLALQKKI